MLLRFRQTDEMVTGYRLPDEMVTSNPKGYHFIPKGYRSIPPLFELPYEVAAGLPI